MCKMKQTKKEIKRLKRAEKNGARIQYFNSQRAWKTLRGKSNWLNDIEYRIHPEDLENFTKRGDKILKPEELVKGEWYNLKSSYLWTVQFIEINGRQIVAENAVTVNDGYVHGDEFQLGATVVKKITASSKKQIKKAKNLLGFKDSCKEECPLKECPKKEITEIKKGEWFECVELGYMSTYSVGCKYESMRDGYLNSNNGIESFWSPSVDMFNKYFKRTTPPENKVDFSILNDEDIFFSEIENGYKYVTVGDPRKKTIVFSYYQDTIIQGIVNINNESYKELRLATKEEKRKVYELRPDLIPDDFSDWWIDQKVWSLIHGEGFIDRIDVQKDHKYVIGIVFKKSCGHRWFTRNGFLATYNKNKSLFPYPIKVVRA